MHCGFHAVIFVFLIVFGMSFGFLLLGRSFPILYSFFAFAAACLVSLIVIIFALIIYCIPGGLIKDKDPFDKPFLNRHKWVFPLIVYGATLILSVVVMSLAATHGVLELYKKQVWTIGAFSLTLGTIWQIYLWGQFLNDRRSKQRR